jgi:hypothetical protein
MKGQFMAIEDVGNEHGNHLSRPRSKHFSPTSTAQEGLYSRPYGRSRVLHCISGNAPGVFHGIAKELDSISQCTEVTVASRNRLKAMRSPLTGWGRLWASRRPPTSLHHISKHRIRDKWRAIELGSREAVVVNKRVKDRPQISRKTFSCFVVFPAPLDFRCSYHSAPPSLDSSHPKRPLLFIMPNAHVETKYITRVGMASSLARTEDRGDASAKTLPSLDEGTAAKISRMPQFQLRSVTTCAPPRKPRSTVVVSTSRHWAWTSASLWPETSTHSWSR